MSNGIYSVKLPQRTHTDNNNNNPAKNHSRQARPTSRGPSHNSTRLTHPRTQWKTGVRCSLCLQQAEDREASTEQPYCTVCKTGTVPGVAELLEPIGGELARARGEGLAEGVRVAKGGGVEGIVDLLRRRLAVALEDDLRQLCLRKMNEKSQKKNSRGVWI